MVLTLLIAISLLSTRAIKPLCARILGFNYLLFSIQNLLATLIFSEVWPQGIVLRATLALFIGPALYFYFCSVMTTSKLKLKQILPHLLPVPIVYTAMHLSDGLVVDILIICSFLGYFSYTVIQYLNRNSDSCPPTVSKTLAIRWLGILLCVMLINLLVEVGIIVETFSDISVSESFSLYAGSFLFLSFHLFIFVLTLTRAPLLEWMHELKALSIHSSRSLQLSKEQLHEIYTKWEKLVNEKALYLSENNISVSRAAKMLGIPSRQLSQAINVTYGASFSQYLNGKRVERAKTLLCQNLTLPVTDVYLAAGFSTKSHFHREFSRSTGMTPSEFRLKHCQL